MKGGELVKGEYDGESLTGEGILLGGGGYIFVGDFLWRSLV
jgi:hypothetical protein